MFIKVAWIKIFCSSFHSAFYQMVPKMSDHISVYSFLSCVGKREERIKISREINYTNHVYPLLGKSTQTDEWQQFSWSFAPSNFVHFILQVYNFTDIQILLPHWQIKQQHFTMKCIAIQRQNSERNEYISL